jgi:hypothetical protein
VKPGQDADGGVGGDPVGDAGQLVEHLAQRREVFHRPAEPVGQQGAERVEHRRRRRLDRERPAGQGPVDPAAAADRLVDALEAVDNDAPVVEVR